MIGIALLTQLPSATCDALDVNDIAVDLANKNAELVLNDKHNDNDGNGSNDDNKDNKKKNQRYLCKLQSFMEFVQSGGTYTFSIFIVIIFFIFYIIIITVIIVVSVIVLLLLLS